jgi:hypothetical protein
MKKFLYRILVHSHPRQFREQFGDEMLSIFEEVAPESSTALIADGVSSLLRQRIARSNLWKMACGAAISAFLIGVWATEIRYVMEPSLELVMKQTMSLQWAPPGADQWFDREEFQRETAAAVAILAESHRKDDQERHRQLRVPRTQPSAPLAPEPRT